MKDNKKIELTEEQLEGVVGGYNYSAKDFFLRADGKIEFQGDVFGLSTEEDYEYVLKTYGEDFRPIIADIDMVNRYFDWYYQKFGRPHGWDGR